MLTNRWEIYEPEIIHTFLDPKKLLLFSWNFFYLQSKVETIEHLNNAFSAPILYMHVIFTRNCNRYFEIRYLLKYLNCFRNQYNKLLYINNSVKIHNVNIPLSENIIFKSATFETKVIATLKCKENRKENFMQKYLSIPIPSLGKIAVYSIFHPVFHISAFIFDLT